MPDVSFPYGHNHISFHFPADRYLGALQSTLQEAVCSGTPAQLVQNALEHPLGTPRLRDLSRGKRRIVILASDHTRPVPSKILAPALLKEIRQGNPEAEITFLIATGCHRATTREELCDKFGEDVVASERIIIHDCDDTKNLVSLGKLPSGGELILNRLAVDADLLLSEGFIEPHFFAGFSGGRKSVLPGIASRATVLYNHSAAMIASTQARTGILQGNPIHADMCFAAGAAHLAFCLNVVLNGDKQPVFAAAGTPEAVHAQGSRYLEERCTVEARPADLVITSNGGYPLDQNIYQAVKGMTAAEATVNPGGVIIMLARSEDGHGGASFYETFRQEPDLNRLVAGFMKTPPEETRIDQWQSQIFARVLQKASVIYVSDAPDEMVRDLHMLPAHTPEDALQLADSLLRARGRSHGTILAIPDGVSVIVAPPKC